MKKIEITVDLANEGTEMPGMSMTYDGTPEDFAKQAKAMCEEYLIGYGEEYRSDYVVGGGWEWRWGYEVAVADPFWNLP